MPFITDAQKSFARGVLSELLHAAAQLELFRVGLAECRGWIGLPQGGMTRRPGTLNIARAKTDSGVGRLVDFRFNRTQSYVCLFTESHIRFYRGNGALGTGSPYEITHDLSSAEVAGMDWQQSNDVLYIATGSPKVRRLERYADDDWRWSTAVFENGPFRAPNKSDIKITATTGVGSNVTLNATGAVFDAGMVGGLFRFDEEDLEDVPGWHANMLCRKNDYVRFDGRVYKVTEVRVGDDFDRTSANPPVHEKGKWQDGNDGPVFEYVHGPYGIVEILTVSSATQATAKVLKPLPLSLSTAGTKIWFEGAWSTYRGGPHAVSIIEQRLTFATKFTVDFSVAADFLNFDLAGGPADAISVETVAREEINWMAESGGLVFSTDASEQSIRSTRIGEALTPDNAKPRGSTKSGSARVRPVQTNNALLFMDATATNLMEFKFDVQVDGAVAEDLTLVAEGELEPGVTEMVWQARPNRHLWLRITDGNLVCFCYEPRQGVYGVWPQTIEGASVVSSCVIPSANGTEDELWMLVSRDVAGSSQRYIEKLSRPFRSRRGDDPKKAVYLDGAKIYDGAPATVFSGLDHLEGREISVFADGAMRSPVTVSGGSVTLDKPASIVVFGLDYAPASVARTLPVNLQSQRGLMTGRKRQPKNIAVDVLDTVMLQVRQVAEKEEDQSQLRWEDLVAPQGGKMTSARGPRKGVVMATVHAVGERVGQVDLRPVGGFPATVREMNIEWSVPD